jgi:hypothetical protein
MILVLRKQWYGLKKRTIRPRMGLCLSFISLSLFFLCVISKSIHFRLNSAIFGLLQDKPYFAIISSARMMLELVIRPKWFKLSKTSKHGSFIRTTYVEVCYLSCIKSNLSFHTAVSHRESQTLGRCSNKCALVSFERNNQNVLITVPTLNCYSSFL